MSQGLTVCFNSKVPHHTPWLTLSYPVDDVPEALIAALENIGWANDKRFRRTPPLDGRQEVTISAPRGDAIFGSWTVDEKARKMRRVRRVLQEHQLANVPWNKLTAADLM